MHDYVLSCFSRVWLFATPWTVARQAPLPVGFSRQEYWGGLPCPPPGDLPNPGIEPGSLMSSALAGGSLLLEPPRKHNLTVERSTIRLFGGSDVKYRAWRMFKWKWVQVKNEGKCRNEREACACETTTRSIWLRTQVAGGWATGRNTAAEVRQWSGHEGLQVRSLIIILKAVEPIYVI